LRRRKNCFTDESNLAGGGDVRSPINVLVWNEYRQEREEERLAKIYLEEIHGQLAKVQRVD
jgi:hypothetical protein